MLTCLISGDSIMSMRKHRGGLRGRRAPCLLLKKKKMLPAGAIFFYLFFLFTVTVSHNSDEGARAPPSDTCVVLCHNFKCQNV